MNPPAATASLGFRWTLKTADLEEIPDQITKSLNIIPVEWIDEVISAALVEEPTPNSKKLKSRKTKNQSKNTNKIGRASCRERV